MGKDIRLTNGELLEVNVNFLTLKLIMENGIDKLEKKITKAKDEDEKNLLSMELASKMIYVILRSNGKKVDEEEALMLVPMDVEDITELFNQFGEKLNDFKKKEELKAQAKRLANTI